MPFEPEERSLTPAGKKAVDKKRRYKDMQEVIDTMMHMPLTEEQATEITKDMPLSSLKNKTLDVMTVCVMAQVTKAMTGDLNSFTALAKYGGYEPIKKEKIEVVAPVFTADLPEKDDERVLTNEELLERARRMALEAEQREAQDAEYKMLESDE